MTTTNKGSNKKNGTIKWEIANLDELKHLQLEIRDFGGFYWKVQPSLHGEKLVFHMDCNGSNRKDCFYICKTTMKLEMKEQEDTEKAVTLIEEWDSRHWTNFFNWNLSTDAAKITAGTFPKMLRLRIAVTWTPCKESLPEADTVLLIKPKPMNNRAIPVNRFILAGHSAFFRRLFFASWLNGEKPHLTSKFHKKPCYEINVYRNSHFNLNDFCMMLCSVQLLGVKLCELDFLQAMDEVERVDRCMAIVRMAFDFQLPLWLEYGQNLLISAGPGTMPALEMAESLDLPALKRHCLKTLDLLDYAKHFGANQHIYGRLSGQTQELIDASLESNTNSYRRKRKRLDTIVTL